MDKFKPFAFVLFSLIINACSVQVMRGSGEIVTERRQVSGFDQVKVCCGMHIALTQGQSESLEIQADDNLLPEITSTVQGDELVVQYIDSFLETSYRPSQPVQVFVSLSTPHRVELSGGGRLNARELNTDQIRVKMGGGSRGDFESLTVGREANFNISGGGRLQIEEIVTESLGLDLSGGSEAMIISLTAQSMNLEISGGGNALIAGRVNEQIVNLSGSSDYDARELNSQIAILEMSGGGEATLWVEETLEVNLGGGSRVDYFGSPEVNQNLSGGSRLSPLGDK